MKKTVRNYKYLVLPSIQILFLTFVWILQSFYFIGEILVSIYPLLVGISIFIDILYFGSLLIHHKINWKPLLAGSICLMTVYTLLQIPVFNHHFSDNPNFVNSDNSQAGLKVMSFNIYYRNDDMASTIATVKTYQPDVLMIYELTDSQYSSLKTALGDDYPYSHEPTSALNGAFSKYKFDAENDVVYSGGVGYINVKITKDDISYSIYGIHPPAMLGTRSTAVRYRNIDDLVDDIYAETTSNIIIAGDYNMVPWVSAYTYMMNKLPAGYYDAGKGRGVCYTWSPFTRFDLPVSCIDHILVNPSLMISDYQNIWINGSDHHAILVKTTP